MSVVMLQDITRGRALCAERSHFTTGRHAIWTLALWVVAMNSSHLLLPERVKVVLEACRSVRYEGDFSWTFVRPLAA